METDTRLPFDDMVLPLSSFLQAQNWPTNLIWVKPLDLIGNHKRRWILEQNMANSEEFARTYYEHVRKTNNSIHVDGIGKTKDSSFVYVKDHNIPRKQIYHGIPESSAPIYTIDHFTLWNAIKFFYRETNDDALLQHLGYDTKSLIFLQQMKKIHHST